MYHMKFNLTILMISLYDRVVNKIIFRISVPVSYHIDRIHYTTKKLALFSYDMNLSFLLFSALLHNQITYSFALRITSLLYYEGIRLTFHLNPNLILLLFYYRPIFYGVACRHVLLQKA